MGTCSIEQNSNSRAERPIYLRLSVTERCNYRCVYCRPSSSSGRIAPGLSDDEILTLVRSIARVAPLEKLRLTGGEPLARSGLADLIGRLRRALPQTRLGLTTNGSMLGQYAAALRDAGLDALNISIDALDPEIFRRITRGGDVGRVLQGLQAARRAKFDRMKLNTVLMRTVNDHQLSPLILLAHQLGCEIRFIELMPIGVAAARFQREYLSAQGALELLQTAGFEIHGPLPESAVATAADPALAGLARRYLLRRAGLEVAVGFITPVSHPFCSGCNRLRLDSHGRLLPCLRHDEGTDLATPLRAGQVQRLDHLVRAAIEAKDPSPRVWRRSDMVAVGG